MPIKMGIKLKSFFPLMTTQWWLSGYQATAAPADRLRRIHQSFWSYQPQPCQFKTDDHDDRPVTTGGRKTFDDLAGHAI
jgi:hypothetical protein